MATFKDIVKQALLRHCLEVTDKVRIKEDKKAKGKLSRDKVREIESSLLAGGWSAGVVANLMKAISIATDRPEIMEPTKVRVPEFAIVVLEANRQSHTYSVGKPYIATCDNGGTNGYLLHHDGKSGDSVYGQSDNPRFATEEECRECIDSLTDAQIKTIMTHSFFHPVTLEAMNIQISIPEHTEKTDVSMPDGRTITV